MPGLVMRMLAAICYMVPWLDVIGMGREVWRRLINLVILLWIPGDQARSPVKTCSLLILLPLHLLHIPSAKNFSVNSRC